MQDAYGRIIDYIRISVTDRCNLRCEYCMPVEGVPSVSHNQILTYDEIVRLCGILVGLGITKVKLTGGEPLVRRDLASLISGVKAVEGMEEVTITTNGTLLAEQAEAIVEAGIDAVNISLDTLDPNRYCEITRGGNIKKVVKGINTMLQMDEVPVKINCVPNAISDEEILMIAELAHYHNLHVRYIELMPIGNKENYQNKDKNQEDRIKYILEKTYGKLTECTASLGNGPSRYWSVENFVGKIGFISAMSHKFCHECNRIRLTAEGYLKTCLQYETGEDLFPLLRSGATDLEIETCIRRAIEQKPKEHGFLTPKIEKGEKKSMSQIGG